MKQNSFHEKQYVRGVFSLIFLFGINVFIIGILAIAWQSESFEDSIGSLIGFTILGAVILGLMDFILLYMRLETIVDNTGVRFIYFPFVRWKQIPIAEIERMGTEEKIYLNDENSFRNTWGVNKYPNDVWVYSTRSSYFLVIKRTNGRTVKLSTRRRSELDNLIANWDRE
jgi:hypothetical protein